LSLTHPNSAYPNKITAFIAAIFTPRLIGRVPFGQILIRPQCSDVWGDPRLPTAVKESGSRTEFYTYDASDKCTTHHGPWPRDPGPRFNNWVRSPTGPAAPDQRARFLG